MKITRKLLQDKYNLFNSHNIWKAGGARVYIDYTPADNGRLTSHYAYWTIRGIRHKPEYSTEYMPVEFTVTCRENKLPQLSEAIKWAEKHLNIPVDEWERDLFGNYQVKGTMDKIVSKESEVK